MSSLGRSVPKFLFCYACRPNFHHKYLTPSDPPLSACGEALISWHTRADRPKSFNWNLGWPQSNGGLSFLPVALCCLCTWLQQEANAVEERLCIWRTDSVVSLNAALLSGSFLLSLLSGQMRKGQPATLSTEANIYHLWYVLVKYRISSDGLRGGVATRTPATCCF